LLEKDEAQYSPYISIRKGQGFKTEKNSLATHQKGINAGTLSLPIP
jgi:hypothetical protein